MIIIIDVLDLYRAISLTSLVMQTHKHSNNNDKVKSITKKFENMSSDKKIKNKIK